MRKLLDRLPLTFTAHALLYPILPAAALLFAQGVKLPISHTVFLFVLMLPLISAIQLIAAKLAIKVTFRASALTPRKRTPLLINILIKNRGLLPFSLIEASLTLPDKRGEKLEDCRFVFSLLPFSSCRIDRSIEFAFRGEWQIGVNCIYVYDFMRTMRLRIPANCRSDIFVMPRVLTLEEKSPEIPGEQITPQASHDRSRDNTEPEDIRAYRPGDSRKSVHWKLSSKSEDLIVKEFADESTRSSVILCCTEPFGNANKVSDHPRTVKEEFAETADPYCADLAVETALAAIRRELEKKVGVLLAVYENGVPVIIHIKDESEFDANYRRIACIKSSDTANQFTELAESSGDACCSSLILIGAHLDKAHSADCLSAVYRLSPDSAPEFRLCAAQCMFENSLAETALKARIRELENDGIDVIITQNI